MKLINSRKTAKDIKMIESVENKAGCRSFDIVERG